MRRYIVVVVLLALCVASIGYTNYEADARLDHWRTAQVMLREAIASGLELALQRDAARAEAAELTREVERMQVESACSTATIAGLTDALTSRGYTVAIGADGAVTVQREQRRVVSSVPAPRSINRSIAGVEHWRPLVTKWVTYYGGGPANVDQMLSVMAGESEGDPNAANGQHIGLMQIASEVHAEALAAKAHEWETVVDLYDPEFNIRFAAYMSAGGTNWSAWSVKP